MTILKRTNLDCTEILKHVSCFKTFFKENSSIYSIADIVNARSFTIDYKFIVDHNEILSKWINFKDDLIDNCEYSLKCIGLAMHQFIIDSYENEAQENRENVVKLVEVPMIQARISNVEPILQLKDLRVNCYGKLVTVKGTVIKAGHVKLMCQYMTFSCSICSGTQIVKQVDGTYTPPTKCQTVGCRAQSNFNAEPMSNFNRTMSWQSIKIQELLGSEQFDHARIPRMLECELLEDLVKTCIPGDDITVTGVIKVRDHLSNHGKNKQNTVFSLYLEAISVYNNKRHNKSESTEGITFNTNDYYLIKKIHSEPNLFRLLVQSLCPNIYGHEIVKAGLLLALIGGTKSDTFRAESHVLMVGDPGLGKSQMLQACANVAPRGVYVCGNTSTSSGLTVTMTRDEGEYALEAGALMLADQGCCCIDEFDKMPTQHASLLEAMEQQSISIAKAAIVCTLPTRATILAAANPAGGHYNKSKTISENLRMGSPMLSRFDLIFILLDQANEQLDILLSRHILGMHMGNETSNGLNDTSSGLELSTTGRESLRERLQTNGEKLDLIPHNLFRKFIAYSQKYVKSHLSDEAKTLLKAFYLTLRKQFQTGDCTPVTTRQLNSLIRLTQARAKAELREEATKEDAEDVIEIMKFSLIDIFTDSSGILDKTRSQNGTGTSTKSQITKLLRLIQRKSDTESKALFSTNELKEMGEMVGIGKNKFFTVLQNLNIQGFLLNKGQNRYQLVTADV
ncbi:DNA helicase MCM8 isoform X2 [Leptinotarsa decemlineata]|uniref:DNA helicase MCM8 isoform X2 n=1 Tax=Leptinotarsa decemlineata TaxID=7539 RepID=UPI003D30AEF7